ncbi:MAG TPA: endonuclease V [Acetobacteraceae bacterium]|nr:endonuclease V [Acetobacteraceae bacterium]
MSAIPPHWIQPADLKEARRAQEEMAGAVIANDEPREPAALGGADTSAERFDPARRVFAAIVTLGAAGGVIASATQAATAPFPYVPGFLGFREVPALVTAWERLAVKPDLLLVDGHGIAHPRGLGVATHLGLVLDHPTVGVAKSLLVGRPAHPLAEEPGARAPLVWRGRAIGVALRTRRRANPLYISVGHRVSLERAVSVVLATLGGRRLPEAVRAAHDAANTLRRAALARDDGAG